MDQEKLDLFKEEEEKALRKKSNIRDALDSATEIIREFKFWHPIIHSMMNLIPNWQFFQNRLFKDCT